MAKISPYVFFQQFDNNGEPLTGGLLYTYEAGTSTPKATYTDAGEGTENANPVVLDASGRANVWLGSGSYKFVLKTSAGVLVKEVDNIVGEASNVFGGSVVSVTTNLAVTDVYQNNFLDCTGSLTLSLLDTSTAEEGFLFTVKNSGNGIVTLDPDASETINGEASLNIYPSQSCIVVCDGTGWKTAFLGQYRRNNYSGTTAPTINDDSADGYAEGSVWYDTTNDEAYICLDATEGAAVWLNATLTPSDLGSAALATLIDDDTFATATATNIASAESTKAYVDGLTYLKATSVTQSTGQTLSNGWNVLAFDTEDYDDSGWHDNATNNSRITVDSDGRYNISGAYSTADTNNGIMGIAIAVNGTRKWSFRVNSAGTVTDGKALSIAQFGIPLSSGDYVEIHAQHSSAPDNTNIAETRFCVQKVR